ncbi:MAG: two component transcriptional regulator, LuxR family [Frankiales bacterium]|nr:two component transcriptional regulator, LuxR family [Frankiales bacterium]
MTVEGVAVDADQVFRVLLVDDQQLWRQIVTMHLSGEPDLEVVGEAADAATALDLARSLQPDLVVLDLDLGGESGASLLEPMRAVAPGVQVLVLSGTEEVADVVAAFGAGAVGYLPKDHPAEEFADALRTVAHGRPVLPEQAVGAVMEEFRRQANRVSAPVAAPVLSDRELEVLAQLGLGKSNRQIGSQLFISENTVKNHVRNILAKLEVSSRVEAVSRALGTGLLSTLEL